MVEPLPLVKDGDLVALVQYMIRTRGRETVRVTKVKGMLRIRMCNMVGFGCWINRGTLIDARRNHDGRVGTAPDPLVWDQGGPKKARKA